MQRSDGSLATAHDDVVGAKVEHFGDLFRDKDGSSKRLSKDQRKDLKDRKEGRHRGKPLPRGKRRLELPGVG